MISIEWTPITETEEIPSMGEALRSHLETRRGEVRYASCSVWGLLRRMLADRCLPVGTVAFTETGKPFFSDSPIHFSLSHTKGICAAVIADHPVGVDVERVRDAFSPRLIEKSLSDSERAVFDGDFTRLWCRKEAFAKMTGEGIRGYPCHIDTTAFCFQEQKIEYGGRLFWLAVAEEQECEK